MAVPVDMGHFVSRGSRLVVQYGGAPADHVRKLEEKVLDPEPFQNRVDSLTAQIILAREDAERARTLLESRNISQRDADAAFTRLASLTGQLDTAQFELDETTVRAPTDGYVAQMALRPGMRAMAVPLRPVMVFVHKEGTYFVGWFRQNSMLRLVEGDEAEIAFDGIPGHRFLSQVVKLPVWFPTMAPITF